MKELLISMKINAKMNETMQRSILWAAVYIPMVILGNVITFYATIIEGAFRAMLFLLLLAAGHIVFVKTCVNSERYLVIKTVNFTLCEIALIFVFLHLQSN